MCCKTSVHSESVISSVGERSLLLFVELIYSGKVKLSLCTLERITESGVMISRVLTILYGNKRQFSCPSLSIPWKAVFGTHYIKAGWSPKPIWTCWRKGQFLSSAQNRNMIPLSIRLQRKSLYRLSHLVSLLVLGIGLL